MDPHPDSALALLDTLHAEPQHYTAKDRARYYLLLTEAMDKCFLTHTTDTLIRFSAEYYEQHNDRHHYAKALYLQGRIYEDWQENDQSVACWVKALDYGKDSEDHYLLYRIAYRLATLYAYPGRSLWQCALGRRWPPGRARRLGSAQWRSWYFSFPRCLF